MPTTSPTVNPTVRPTSEPSKKPSSLPTGRPSEIPSGQPTGIPSDRPSAMPSISPISQPTYVPSTFPTIVPTTQPSSNPSAVPSNNPTTCPSLFPSRIPSSNPSSLPSSSPSTTPVAMPSSLPSGQPSEIPTARPSNQPVGVPSSTPSASPTKLPSSNPTSIPSLLSSSKPSNTPSSIPSITPTDRLASMQPSGFSTSLASITPSTMPTIIPSIVLPDSAPSSVPSAEPNVLSNHPSLTPTVVITTGPSLIPTPTPSVSPSIVPTQNPTRVPSTTVPSLLPSCDPSRVPTKRPSLLPTQIPTISPTSHNPTIAPSKIPSFGPTTIPTTLTPTKLPSAVPTFIPSTTPTTKSVSALAVVNKDKLITGITRTSIIVNVTLSFADAVYVGIASAFTAQPTSLSSIMLQNRYFAPSSGSSQDVVISISSLQPATTYYLYLYPVPQASTSSVVVQESTFEFINASRISFQTLCCKEINVDWTTLLMVGNADTAANQLINDFIQFNSLSSPTVSSSLVVSLFAINKATNATTSVSKSFAVVYPSMVQFNRGQTIQTSLRLSVNPKLPSGWYAFSVTIQEDGSDIPSFDIVSSRPAMLHDGLFVFQVIHPSTVDSELALPAPVLKEASFSADGSKVTVAFDRDTDLAAEKMNFRFLCDKLFSFSCAEKAYCSWQSSSQVDFFISKADDDECIKPMDNIALAAGSGLRAACPTSVCSTHDSWPVSDTSETIVVKPSTSGSVAPVVVITLPSRSTACASLILDVTTSTGHGGRRWLDSVIEVTFSDDANMTMARNASQQSLVQESLQAYLTSSFGASKPLSIPGKYISTPGTYKFTARLCNFLGQCSSTSKSLEIVSTVIPIVSIAGATIKTMKRQELLSISAQASLPKTQCEGEMSTSLSSRLSYRWRVYKSLDDGSQTEVFGLVSQSKTINKFVLSAYSLLASTSYTIQVVVDVTVGNGATSSSSSNIQISVVSGSLVPVILQGSELFLRDQEEVILDGSTSYHEDYSTSDMNKPSFAYSWSCVQISPSLGESCSGMIDIVQHSSDISAKPTIRANITEEFMLHNGNISFSSIQAEITMIVTFGETAASKAVAVTILPSLAPKVTILSTYGAIDTIKINSMESLRLLSGVNIPVPSVASSSQLLAYNLSWSMSGGADSLLSTLSTLALTPVSISATDPIKLIASSSDGLLLSRNMNLVLPGNILSPGTSYIFKLSCFTTYSSVSASRSVYNSFANFVVQVNDPPRGGKFALSPPEGEELSTEFMLSCSQWIDEDLPLTFTFGYQTPSGNEMMIRSRSEAAFTETVMPAGPIFNDYQLVAIAAVFDNLLADAKVLSSVRVVEMAASSIQETKDLLTSYLGDSSSSDDLDTLKQASAIASYLLNKVNCSLAPINCSSAYNRMPCSKTAHTCGACLADYPFGDQDDSNTFCYASVDSMLKAETDRRLLINQENVANKSCPSDCSGHGTCQFKTLQTPVRILSSCISTDLSCYAECICDASFAGDAICSTSSDDLQWKQQARNQLIANLAAVYQSEDVTTASVVALQTMLIEASQFWHEIDPATSMGSILNLTSSYITESQLLGLDSAALSSTFSILDNVAKAFTISSITNQSSLSVANGSSSFFSFMSTLSGLLNVISNDLVSNQDAVGRVEDLFSVINAKTTLSTKSDLMSLSLPQSSIQEALLLKTPQVSVVSTSRSEESDLAISVSTISSDLISSEELYGLLLNGSKSIDNQVLSNVINIKMSTTSGNDLTSDLYFSLPLIPYEDLAQNNVEEYSTSCEANGEVTTKSFTCLSSGETLKLTCDGIRAGKVVQRCPTLQRLPSCQLLQMEGTSFDGVTYNCSREAYDKVNGLLKCRCNMEEIKARRLLLNTTDDTTVSVSIISLLEATKTSFVSTWESAEDLNINSLGGDKSRPALLTMSLFIGVALIFVFVASVVDELHEDEEEEMLAQQGKQIIDDKRALLATGLGQSKKKLLNATSASQFSWSTPTKWTVKLIRFSREFIANKTEAWSFYGGNVFKKIDPKLRTRGEMVPTIVKRQKSLNEGGSALGKEHGLTKRNDILSLAEEALPKVLSSKSSFQAKCIDELKRHHRWLAIIYFYSKKFSRVLRVVALITNIIIMLFIQSITYNLTRGSDANCSPYSNTSEVECLTSQSSPYDSRESMCYWVSETQECKYREPSNNEMVIFYVAIFSALITTPLTLIVDWIIQHILAAPTAITRPSQGKLGWINGGSNVFKKLLAKVTPLPSDDLETVDNISPTTSPAIRENSGIAESPKSQSEIEEGPNPSKGRKSVVQFLRNRRSTNILLLLAQRKSKDSSADDKTKDVKNVILQAQSDYRLLSQELVRYRSFLSEMDRKEFDHIWGLNSNGLFITKGSFNSDPTSSSSSLLSSFSFGGARHDVAKTVLNDLEQVGKDQQHEMHVLTQANQNCSDRERNKRILFLFQKDLLSGISGKILESKDRRDYAVLEPVSSTAKIIAWSLLFLANTGMLIYVFLFAVGQAEARQQAWSRSFGVWLLMEIIVVSSLMTIVTHVVVPSLIMKDVQEIKRKIALNVASYYQDLSSLAATQNKYAVDEEKEVAKAFNAASYLFVSYRIAKLFPELKASKIIMRFKTVWPRQSYQHVTDLTSSYSKKFSALTRSASLVILFFLTSVFNLPTIIHDLIFQTIALLLAGSVVLLHIELYRVSPALVVLPSFAIIAIIYVFTLQRKDGSFSSSVKNILPAPINIPQVEVEMKDKELKMERIVEDDEKKDNDDDQEEDHENEIDDETERNDSLLRHGQQSVIQRVSNSATIELQKLGKVHQQRKKAPSTVVTDEIIPTQRRERFAEGKSGDCNDSAIDIVVDRETCSRSSYCDDDSRSRSGSDQSRNRSGSGSRSYTESRSRSGSGNSQCSGNDNNEHSGDSYCDSVSHHSFKSLHSVNSLNLDLVMPGDDEADNPHCTGRLREGTLVATSTVQEVTSAAIAAITRVMKKEHYKNTPNGNKEKEKKDEENKDKLLNHEITNNAVERPTDQNIIEQCENTSAVNTLLEDDGQDETEDDDAWIMELLEQQSSKAPVDQISQSSVGHQSRRDSTLLGFELLKKARKSILK